MYGCNFSLLIDNRAIQQMDGCSCYGEINSIPLKVLVATSNSFKEVHKTRSLRVSLWKNDSTNQNVWLQVLFWNSNTLEIEVSVKHPSQEILKIFEDDFRLGKHLFKSRMLSKIFAL